MLSRVFEPGWQKHRSYRKETRLPPHFWRLGAGCWRLGIVRRLPFGVNFELLLGKRSKPLMIDYFAEITKGSASKILE
jgi:hypothetical protein